MKRVNLASQNAISVVESTHEGMTGKNNEDAHLFTIFEPLPAEEGRLFYLAVVADGVGGQSAGELASNLAIDSVVGYFDELESITTDTVLSHLEESISSANEAVHKRAESDPELQGMATTMVIVAILEGLLFISHVGDSRAYIWRERTLHQLTKDHTWVQEAVDAGLLSAEQGSHHPNRNIIRRSLGSLEEVVVDQEIQLTPESVMWQGMPLQREDIILLCSDGLTDMISGQDIALILDQKETTLTDAAREMIDKANAAGGRDNITVILLRATSVFSPHENPPYPPPDPPLAETGRTDSITSDTIRNMPRVVSVPLDKDAKAAKARRRRRWIMVMISLILLVLIAAGMAYFGLFTQ